MAKNRHSYVRFFPSDWLAGTARMPRMHKSVYLDICCAIWDTAEPVNPIELTMMLSDVPDWQRIVEDLVQMRKLDRADDGSLINERAMDEARQAKSSWQASVDGGRKGGLKSQAKRGSGTPPDGAGHEPEPEPEPEPEILPSGNIIRVADIFDAWNAMAARCKVSKASKLTDSRRTHIAARIAEHGGQAILDAIAKVPASRFLNGQNERGWIAGIDNIIRPDNMAKLIEGAYHRGRTGKQSGWL